MSYPRPGQTGSSQKRRAFRTESISVAILDGICGICGKTWPLWRPQGDPAPGENIISGNLVMETGCIIITTVSVIRGQHTKATSPKGHVRERSPDIFRGREDTVDQDPVASNRSIDTLLSSLKRDTIRKARLDKIWARWGFQL